jgi:hypothetical protein
LDCVERTQDAVAELRAEGIGVEIEPDDWLAFEPRSAETDAEVGALLDPIWPSWRECVTE